MPLRYVKVTELHQIPRGKARTAHVAGHVVALFNVGGRIFATQDACPHEGVSLGCGGRLTPGGVVACGYHHWEFDVATGASVDGMGEELVTYPVRIEGGSVYVGIEDDEPPP